MQPLLRFPVVRALTLIDGVSCHANEEAEQRETVTAQRARWPILEELGWNKHRRSYDEMLIQLILILPPLLGLAFLLWMAWDVSENDTLSSREKTSWMWAFLFMNVFAAGYYYATEYRKRH